jgi:hypothetical protein
VIAYKFLREGRVAPFTGFRWETGAWVEPGDPVACDRGVHACRAEDLPYWLRTELWEIELGGAVVETERKVVAERGRLVRRLERWNGEAAAELARTCARRTRSLATRHPADDRLRRIAHDIGVVIGRGDLLIVPYFASVAAERAGGLALRLAERRAQAAWLAANVL